MEEPKEKEQSTFTSQATLLYGESLQQTKGRLDLVMTKKGLRSLREENLPDSEQQVEVAPLVAQAKSYLKSQGDLSDTEIIEIFREKNSPEIVITANFLYELTVKSGASELRGFSDHFIVDCALKALGVKSWQSLLEAKPCLLMHRKRLLLSLLERQLQNLA